VGGPVGGGGGGGESEQQKLQVAPLLRILDPMTGCTSKNSKHFWSLTIPSIPLN
jgi:hypothetical protein